MKERREKERMITNEKKSNSDSKIATHMKRACNTNEWKNESG